MGILPYPIMISRMLASSPDPACKGLVTRNRKVWHKQEALQYVNNINAHLLQTTSFDKRWYLWLHQIAFKFLLFRHFLSYIQVEGAKSKANLLPSIL